MAPKWQFITKKKKKIFPETDKVQGFACKMLILLILELQTILVILVHHSAFDTCIFKMASKIVADKLYKPVGAAPYL